jgi:hypothetical protein
MVDWSANRIRVPAATTKSNADVRVPIQPELRAILEEAAWDRWRPIQVWGFSRCDARVASRNRLREPALETGFLFDNVVISSFLTYA